MGEGEGGNTSGKFHIGVSSELNLKESVIFEHASERIVQPKAAMQGKT